MISPGYILKGKRKFCKVLILTIILFTFYISNTFAATRTIRTSGGQWVNSSIWQGGNIPVDGDDVASSVNNLTTFVNGSINLTLTGIAFTKSSTVTLWSGANLVINGDFTSNSDLTIVVNSGATLTVNGNISSQGTLSVTNGGTMTVTGTASGKNAVSITTNGDEDFSISGGLASASGGVTMQLNGNGDRDFGGITAKNDITVTKNGTGTVTIDGDVSTSSGDITLTGNSGTIDVIGTVDSNNDLDIVSNGGSVVHIYGGANAGNNASFTANDDLIIEGVVDVGNGAIFTGNGGGAFELGGISGGNNTSLTFNGDATIDGDVSLGQGTTMTVNSGTTVVTGSFSAGGGTTNYTVHSDFVVGEDLNLDGGSDQISGYGEVTTGGSCSYDTGGSATITQNCSVTTPIALPVSLVSFEVEKSDNSVKLQWSTASELNNDFFTLEKSNDGYNFKEIAKVLGSGTTKLTNQYTFFDSNSSIKSYYRLSQTDFDGTVEILKTILLNGESVNLSSVSCYPNPMINTRTLHVSEVVQETYWDVYNINGTLISSGNFESASHIELENLTPGNYFIRIMSGESAKTLKVIIK